MLSGNMKKQLFQGRNKLTWVKYIGDYCNIINITNLIHHSFFSKIGINKTP